MPEIEFPHPGCQAWTNHAGIRIFRLHYTADTEKNAAWAAKQKAAMTDPAAYQQEYEIDFSAKLGTLLFQLDEAASLEHSFPIPPDWTRYYGLDPHTRTPDASLWLAIDPWGDGWIYRELWPSRVYGQPGNIPEDDVRHSKKDYVETVLWLESKENADNEDHDEKIFKRVIDYSARAFGQGMSDENPSYSLQNKFEDLGLYPFEDAVKDHDSGIETVNQWLKPRLVEQKDGSFKPKSKLHIFADKCPELLYQLKTNRYQQLSPLLADRQDPSAKPIAKRNHCTDVLRYLLMANPTYIKPRTPGKGWKPLAKGVAY